MDTLIEHFGERETFSPVEVQRALGCSESSARRLLAEGQERGMITRRETGVYIITAQGRRD
jgi:DNA-binding IclR family transcriptional regulator